MPTTFKRIFQAGLIGFWRNAFVSFASVLVMTVALFMVATTLLNNYSLEVALDELEEKVDINIYFQTTAAEEDILALRGALEALPEVAEVTYTSREEALEQFRSRHEDDELTIQALDELGENPLGASLAVRATETSEYEGIAAFLAAEQDAATARGASIDRVNYFQNRSAIERLTTVIDDTRNNNTLKSVLLILIAVFVAFNTIRLAIHNSRDEIGVMRLVGAGNHYISSPFVITGILQGFIAGILVLVLLYPALLFSEGAFYPFPFFDEAGYQGILLSYYISNFAYLFLVIVGAGIAVGALSSFLAVRRYLHI